MRLKVLAEKKIKQQLGGFLFILSASSHIKCDSCWLQHQKMDFSFQEWLCDINTLISQQICLLFHSHHTITTMTSYILDRLFIFHKSLLLPYESLYVTSGSGGQLWAISVSLCEVSLPVINLMHKYMNTNQSCLLSSTTRPMQPVHLIKE